MFSQEQVVGQLIYCRLILSLLRNGTIHRLLELNECTIWFQPCDVLINQIHPSLCSVIRDVCLQLISRVRVGKPNARTPSLNLHRIPIEFLNRNDRLRPQPLFERGEHGNATPHIIKDRVFCVRHISKECSS
uniref:Uncharacterized protein n=1 Tax=Genomoviridae sp. TaxID=2202565 RepID=A0A8F1NN54_9VIRU|nr:hypothetical protein [Genomoviridae sp.]